MLTLASSSQTRAKILTENGIKFKQISFDFNENDVSDQCEPHIYVQNVVKSKKEQFLKLYPDVKNVIFADSCVACDGKILGKAKNKQDAINMLNLQSGNIASVFTAMIFLAEDFEFINVSETAYKFANFKEEDIKEYIKNGEYKDKAGAMMVEGFNKKYIIKQIGNTSTARGLNVELLKAYL
ncbi:septum formation inhibitor Maf [Campylobacter sp. RM9344]|uniref:Nucleoside triphosphate pyrophosphatase n=1 Tax=Campylobacter californiensis TaxID=1032243 RepID=A0AAW3ZRF4_9BACT|nr:MULTISPECIES: septum formation inhibitor Maf [unclassified Campylobacter]MBE2983964.1 septum formation inhibitor Maf [Campylobacter sp. RM6883]MBE2986126.1 septum formation inhibitor Maf [Campylobacter sp. RM12919]MBE2987539.1 septum formation inhibitor Maf [Campylobacter sp. RM12920]MBE2994502.1 septum formation inhibitor Maf [Campylobacter sp. RM6913]MBE3028810.1 septum formation inhibitor Maf [Campylobacter sp. RM9344]